VSTTDRAQLSSQQCSQLSSDALGDFCSQPQLGAISSSGPYCYLFSVSGTVVRAFRRFNLRAKCSRAKCSRSCSWFLRWLRGARPTGFLRVADQDARENVASSRPLLTSLDRLFDMALLSLRRAPFFFVEGLVF